MFYTVFHYTTTHQSICFVYLSFFKALQPPETDAYQKHTFANVPTIGYRILSYLVYFLGDAKTSQPFGSVSLCLTSECDKWHFELTTMKLFASAERQMINIFF